MDNQIQNSLKDYRNKIEDLIGFPRYKDQIQAIQGLYLAPYATWYPKENSRKKSDEGIPRTETRSEFQRDRDRIIHSSAFRRLMYKTQVFVNHEGDYYRTRMTHSLEVSQISRGIARSLGLNEDLTEAIALGHDLGHTPFGHAVEDLLSDILKNENRFLHNYQSVRVVDTLERKIENFGLNLTWEVREGILKHNSDRTEGIYEDLLPNKPASLEGQVVALVDTIAYLCHDLDDGITAGLLEDKIKVGLLDEDCIKDICESFEKSEEEGISGIIHTLVCDLVDSSLEVIRNNNIQSVEAVRAFEDKKEKNKIIRLGKHKEAFKKLKDFVKENIYQSPMTSIMDEKAKTFVNEIYNTYWKNPRQLPNDIYKRFTDASNNVSKEDGISYDGYVATPSRVLCDHISLMTDRYALETYEKLFSPFTKI